jgi:hypothetical protein
MSDVHGFWRYGFCVTTIDFAVSGASSLSPAGNALD